MGDIMFTENINKEELMQSIRESLQIPSVVGKPVAGKPFGEPCARALQHALDLAAKMGFRTVNLDNRVGYAECGDGEKMVAVLGHLDVVPAGDNWICEPFDATIIDGKIYGRGIADDKGPIIGALYALDAVKKSGKPMKHRVRIIFGSDEEVDCTDMERYKATEEIPMMAFTPDAEYPAIFSEKGMIYFTMKRKVEGLVSAKAGEAVNQVPDKAEITFMAGNKAVTVKSKNGRTAHGSTPQFGVNAIDDVMKQILEMPEFAEASEDFRSFVNFYEKYFMGEFYGEKMGMCAENEEIGRNSSNVGILFGEDGEIGFKVDFRFIPQYDGLGEGEEVLRNIAAQNDMKLEIFKERHALYIPKDSGLIKILQSVFRKHTGNDMQPVAMGGGTYAKFLPNTVAFGPLFPGEEDPIHQPNEYMTVDNFMKNIEIMADAIYEMANYEL